jgi:hypothetical protein
MMECRLMCCPAFECIYQEKVLTPHQVSQLESLLVPPLAAATEGITGHRQTSVTFGDRLMTVLGKSAAAGAGATGRKQQRLTASQVLELLCKQQQCAADKQYIIAVTGSRRKVGITRGGQADRRQDAQLLVCCCCF